MTRPLFVVLSAGLVVVGAALAGAQEQSISLEGRVRDSQDAAVAGVSVRARSDADVEVETMTDGSGVFRWAALPPGHFEVWARLAGFRPARIVNVDLRLGQPLRIDLTLQPAGPDETVEVVSDATLVAITESGRSTSLRHEQIEKMPRGRDFTSLATQVVGVNDERKLAGVSIDGSSAAENRILIDGAETGDDVNGLPGQGLVTDFVEEVQVKSSGYSAEYGGSTGGVLNAITKSGSNAWHGDTVLYWSSDALDAGPRPSLRLNPKDPTRAEYVTHPQDRYDQIEPGFTLGGPIVRDRLWFFAGYVPSFRSLDREVRFLADGSTGTFRQDLNQHNAAANLTGQLGARWRARTAFSTGYLAQRGLLPAQDGGDSPNADYSIDVLNPNYSVSGNLDFSRSSRAHFSLRATYFSNDHRNEGVYRGDKYVYQASSIGVPGVPLSYQQPRLYTNVPTIYSSDKAAAPHLVVQVDGSAFFSGAGEHELKGGAQIDRRGFDVLQGQTGNFISLFWGQRFAGVAGPFGYYSVVSNPIFPNRGQIAEGQARVNNLGLFVQDSWRPSPRLTLHLGLRADDENVPSFAADPRVPKTAIHFGFADKLAPRAGLAWDATGDGRTKVYGTWGVYYDVMKLLAPGALFGALKTLYYWYTLDSGDIGPIVDNPDCPPACPGRLIRGPVNPQKLVNDPDDNQIDPAIQQMRLQEAVVGLERQVGRSLSASVRYVHKQLDRAVEDIGTLDAQMNGVYTIGNPGLGRAASFYPRTAAKALPFPKARRDYDAVEIAFDRRLSRHWAARASYTWSRLFGNYSGLASSDADGAALPNWSRTFDYPLMSFDESGTPVYGRLGTDRPHQWKAHALVDLPSGLSAGASWFGASGIPRTRQAAFVPGSAFPVFYRGRGSDGRLPLLSQLDVYLQHRLRLGERVRLTLSANLINVLNQATATNYYPNELLPGQAVSVDESQFYAFGIDTQALIAQQRLARDARFLMDSAYQAPRTIRLGLKLGF